MVSMYVAISDLLLYTHIHGICREHGELNKAIDDERNDDDVYGDKEKDEDSD